MLQCYNAAYLELEARMPNAESPARGAVTVRGLAPGLKARLRIRAAHNARSMEAEARAILEAALTGPEEEAEDLAVFARSLFAPLGGVELDLPPREPAREPPGFGAGEDWGAEVGAPDPKTSTRKPSKAVGSGTRAR
jgi:plasmid stability protein